MNVTYTVTHISKEMGSSTIAMLISSINLTNLLAFLQFTIVLSYRSVNNHSCVFLFIKFSDGKRQEKVRCDNVTSTKNEFTNK